jgi:hypothetical protein
MNKKLQKIITEFNTAYPVGTDVILRKDSGEIETRVRDHARELCGSAVAWFVGVSGAYSIEDNRVRYNRAAVEKGGDQ